MDPFDESERPTNTFLGSPRYLTFVQSIRDALIPPEGSCVSVQGELVRACDRLTSELLQNGLGNYYVEDEPLRANYYGDLAVFLLDTLIANRNGALSGEDVAFFADALQRLEPARELRLLEIKVELREQEPSVAELQRLQVLEARGVGVDWERLLNLAEGCVANWCMANPALIDRRGRPVEERGLRDLGRLINPPLPAPPCPRCQGKGFVPPEKETGFPELCSCKGGRPRS